MTGSGYATDPADGFLGAGVRSTELSYVLCFAPNEGSSRVAQLYEHYNWSGVMARKLELSNELQLI